jgi:signal transduction histidine kinase
MGDPNLRKLNGRTLSILGVTLALASWLALVLLRVFVFKLPVSSTDIAVELFLVGLGSILFWLWIVSMLKKQEAEIRSQNERLEALHAATVALTTEHELRPVLQKVVDLSRQLINARYGALGILDEDGEKIDQFITSGVSPSTQSRIGHFPAGAGLLGVSLYDGESIRVADIGQDERKAGLPIHHPDMHSFLSVPISSKGRIFGNLYLANKQPKIVDGTNIQLHASIEFTEDDQELLEMFAAQAAIAIEDAQLYRASRQVAVLRERERIGMDLHDGVIQSIYAIGLMLDDTAHRLRDDPDLADERITNAISGLNTVIHNIRAYIHDLRSPDYSDKDILIGLDELIREFEAYTVLEVTSYVDSDAVEGITQRQASQLLHIVQEALTNIRRHSHASVAHVIIREHNEHLVLTIEDDGIGFVMEQSENHAGHGLHNMAERALKAHGTLELDSMPGSGTRISVSIPTNGPTTDS